MNDSPEASSKLLNWNLRLAPECIQLDGRLLAAEKLLLGKNATVTVNAKADWSRESTNNHMLQAVDLKKWAVIFVNKNEEVAKSFTTLMSKLAPKMGMKVAAPDMKILPNDRTETYLKCLREIIKEQLQIVVMIMPTPRDDRYSAVKKLCNVEQPVPSQVINYKTLANEKKASSVVQKVALQMNCKLGGQLWGCQLSPKFGNVMVVGVDVFHDPSRRGSSIAAVVSNTNQTMSSWWSQTAFQTPGQEIVDCLKVAFVEALKKFYEINHIWPDKVIVFRDGVSDSQLELSAAYEARQFVDSFQHITKDFNPGFGFIVVQKRINTRIFLRYDYWRGCSVLFLPFFLSGPGSSWTTLPPGLCWTTPSPGGISTTSSSSLNTSARAPSLPLTTSSSATAWDSPWTPSRGSGRLLFWLGFLLLFSSSVFSYKLTHMYFNWPGTVRVPAPCQYAHKVSLLTVIGVLLVLSFLLF